VTRLPLALVLTLLAAACGREPPGQPDGGPDGGRDAGSDAGRTDDDGGGITLANWNLEFFGDATQNPADDDLQQRNVTAILQDAGFDIAGLEEVVDVTRFNQVVAALPGYDGVVSSDGARVTGTSSCVSFGNPICYTSGEQKLALIYRTQVATLRSAQLILTGDTTTENDFAYRPPLRVDLDVHLADGGTDPLVVIVLHLKAYTDATSYQRRVASSAELKTYLDSTLPTQKVAVIGDWNDDIDVSTAGGAQTPFQNFLNDPSRYTFVTSVLTETNQGTQTFGSTIDHQLVTNELLPQLHQGSVAVIHPELWGISSYTTTTSDHWPVCSRWDR
jgi:endonuclease/exonuclease/phosphatase family metal-dependent hydrolase